MAWLRLHERVAEDEKVQKLAGDLFKFWINILCLAKKLNGLIDTSAAAWKLRMPETRIVVNLERLVTATLVDKREDGSYWMHDWEEWQYELSDSVPQVALTQAERAHRYRERKRNGVVTERHENVTEDRDGSVTDRHDERHENVTAKSDESSRSSRHVLERGVGGRVSVSASVSEEVKATSMQTASHATAYDALPSWKWFYKHYPKDKINPDMDLRLWLSIVTSVEIEEEIRAKLPRFLESASWMKENGAFIPLAETFLSKRKFRMEPGGPPKSTVSAWESLGEASASDH